MSHEKGDQLDASKPHELPSNDQIIDDVINSCKNLKVEDVPHADDDSLPSEVDTCGGDGESPQEEVVVDDEDFIDDVALKDAEMSLSEEDIQRNKATASELKNEGNVLFKEKKFEEAIKKYTEALKICPIRYNEERAILFSNRAACKMAQEKRKEAVADCDRAIELNPTYVRAISRRAKLYLTLEKLDEALEDYKRWLELDPGNGEARAACMRLPDEINERNEKIKQEMLGSLKALGNKFLKPFGLSINNFQMQKDPNSGGYSINFNQNPK